MKLEVNQGIKVLGVKTSDGSLRSCHSGTFSWDPPILNEDGTWTPGAWTPPVKPILCETGYHLTDDPLEWWDTDGLGAFLAEFDGRIDGFFEDSTDRKISVESCRLLRPLTSEELAGYNVFIEGEHVVEGNIMCIAEGNAVVRAFGRVVVYAQDNAKVFAHDSCVVFNYANSSVIHMEGFKGYIPPV